MKFKLENKPEGVIICHILESIQPNKVTELGKGIETVLSNGKARIILNFAPNSIDPKGFSDLEKKLRHYQVLARKMGGDLVYVVSESLAKETRGTVTDLTGAINRILRKEDYSHLDQEKLIAELQVKTERLRVLEAENLIASEKLKELLTHVSEPMNESELTQGLKFYQALAFKAEEQSPVVQEDKAKGKPTPS